MYKRTIGNQIEESLQQYPVIIITGARQVGKSTEAFKFVQSHTFRYVSLDDIIERKQALDDPVFFLQRHGLPLIIDEIQYAPILMEVIESIVNEKRLKEGTANGLFILTGSQTFQSMKNVTQSLAGRATILNMMPLSMNEIRERNEQPFLPTKFLLEKEIQPMNVNELYQRVVRDSIQNNTRIQI